MSEARYDPVADFYATAFDSAALIGKALEAERANPLGMRYVDDLDGALAGADALLRPGGRFVHPCFPRCARRLGFLAALGPVLRRRPLDLRG